MRITLQNDLIKQAFIDSRCVSAIASEEEDAVQHIELGRQVSSPCAASAASPAVRCACIADIMHITAMLSCLHKMIKWRKLHHISICFTPMQAGRI